VRNGQIALADIMLPKVSKSSVGTRILDQDKFIEYLKVALGQFDKKKHDFDAENNTGNHKAGQYLVDMPRESIDTVACGVGLKSEFPSDYHYAWHRECIGKFLHRDKSLKPDKLQAVVYTIDAYINDPDVINNPQELNRTLISRDEGVKYFLVTVIASEGYENPPVGVSRFVRNLAGGNNAYRNMSIEHIRSEAVRALDYWGKYHAVADIIDRSLSDRLCSVYEEINQRVEESPLPDFYTFTEYLAGIKGKEMESMESGAGSMNANELRNYAGVLVRNTDKIIQSVLESRIFT
jgi:hypothetical protein